MARGIVENHVYAHYQKARVDYEGHFLRMYITYNAWYREVTKTANDRQAISILKQRFVIWDDYCHGRVLLVLLPYMQRLSELTQQEPFPSMKLYWDGEVSGSKDWGSLIEFWYQVRCLVVHGSLVGQTYVWLAYETLDIFMAEIIERMQAHFGCDDFFQSADIWQVDMCRVADPDA